MTRVLVVNHDPDIADIEADELRRAGYDVDLCAGPDAGGNCPVMHGRSCWQVDLADVLVYDMWASGDGRRALIDDLALVHPNKPVVLTSAGALMLDWVPSEKSCDATLLGAPTRSELVGAVTVAANAARRRAAEPPSRPPAPRWTALAHRW